MAGWTQKSVHRAYILFYFIYAIGASIDSVTNVLCTVMAGVGAATGPMRTAGSGGTTLARARLSPGVANDASCLCCKRLWATRNTVLRDSACNTQILARPISPIPGFPDHPVCPQRACVRGGAAGLRGGAPSHGCAATMVGSRVSSSCACPSSCTHARCRVGKRGLTGSRRKRNRRSGCYPASAKERAKDTERVPMRAGSATNPRARCFLCPAPCAAHLDNCALGV